jgi:prenyl protein peptidase
MGAENPEWYHQPLCALSAVLLGVLFVASFVCCFRSTAHLPRDAPASIRERLLAICCAAALSPLPLALLLPAPPPLLRHLGASLECNSVAAMAAPLALVTALFAGPLAEAALLRGGAGAWLRSVRGWLSQLQQCDAEQRAREELIFLRTYVCAPLLEEWVFRACALPLWLAAGAGEPAAALLSAAVFGGAHANHYWAKRREGFPQNEALAASVVMVAYTFAFGLIEALAFLRWRSLLGVVAAHAFCNWMGLPQFAFLSPGAGSAPRRTAVGAAYAAGVAAFVLLCTAAGGRWWAAAVAPAPCA